MMLAKNKGGSEVVDQSRYRLSTVYAEAVLPNMQDAILFRAPSPMMPCPNALLMNVG